MRGLTFSFSKSRMPVCLKTVGAIEHISVAPESGKKTAFPYCLLVQLFRELAIQHELVGLFVICFAQIVHAGHHLKGICNACIG